ncbi:MAG: 3-methylornithyl-N6-L-lysine dehydrogenase PylD [Methanosarcinaceae archaeon]|nr:3-methylornithyl-N6-L-lysine dehydrogenase PylD [Methanosarcinaceae archaeon]MDD4330971.1 3-methylornithyl-N6-L-lysine dehydrogenase PylD [Methanosarcinaceae archaeon]MDD4749416.1 3-methylornithyl-N6-L-lysine dehydrogenase PylD [Methanosarcinaceae archaeon]
MALLTPADLIEINRQLAISDEVVRKSTGFEIKGICEALYGTKANSEKVGIVPITSGNGIIGSFSESLLAIVRYFGLEGFITEKTDVSGYYEALSAGADIVLMADDYTYLAHNLKNGKIANNQPCTGIIYAEIASRAKQAGSKEILVVGLGKVGFPGAEHLKKKGFSVYGYDLDKTLLQRAVSKLRILPFSPENPKKFPVIFEATPCPNTIPEAVLEQGCLVSTPGIPCALSENLLEKYAVELVAEPLGIGTVSMLYSIF